MSAHCVLDNSERSLGIQCMTGGGSLCFAVLVVFRAHPARAGPAGLDHHAANRHARRQSISSASSSSDFLLGGRARPPLPMLAYGPAELLPANADDPVARDIPVQFYRSLRLRRAIGDIAADAPIPRAARTQADSNVTELISDGGNLGQVRKASFRGSIRLCLGTLRLSSALTPSAVT